MLKKFGAVCVLFLTGALVVPACTADVSEQPEDVAEVEEALSYCNSDCDCPFGRWCNPVKHQCSSNYSGTCWEDCQCGGWYCVQGECSPEPAYECYSDCDCPRTHICGGDGQCHAWFGPYPECRGCDNHCWDQYGIYSYCDGYYCKVWF